VVFRADASVELGIGHLARCRALAEALQHMGAEVHFLTNGTSASGAEYLQASGFSVHVLDSTQGEEHIEEVCVCLDGAGWDWLVVDHYDIDTVAHNRWRPLVGALAVIDDLANRSCDCDLLLDQNYNALEQGRYDGLLPQECLRLLGPRYALLRPEFEQHRDNRRELGESCGRLLISLGGSDPDNVAARVLSALDSAELGGIEVDLLAGGANPHFEALSELCRDKPSITLHRHVDDPWRLLAATDLVIGAGGGSTWERCCLGVPAVVLSVAENQKDNARRLGEAGIVLYLGDASTATESDIGAAVSFLATNPWLRRHFSDRAQALVDGFGANRVARAMLGMNVDLRLASVDDCERVLEWRNAPQTREQSINSDMIEEKEHRAWFMSALEDPDQIVLIAETGGRAIGVMRYDVSADWAKASIFLAPEEQGRGFGTGILRAADTWLRAHRPEVLEIRAEVLESNPGSRHAFEKAGYIGQRRHYTKSLQNGCG
jgi:UDP-2,4-diacetamido-2,4,6-trideoxy-beta-L-altropyranose hydrolase